ncbi:hypothetical protein DL93DRAFT_2078203 [Clavulina sp. PMI_390]|nr:hypothetical protein DL93DRAFT_2078203 [Clavulina sp. PMI_390]
MGQIMTLRLICLIPMYAMAITILGLQTMITNFGSLYSLSTANGNDSIHWNGYASIYVRPREPVLEPASLLSNICSSAGEQSCSIPCLQSDV